MQTEHIEIESEYINLQQLLKWANVVASGGEAKTVIKEGLVQVNGVVETRIRKKLYAGDQVILDDAICLILEQNDYQKD